VIRHYGIEGLQYHVRRHVELAQQFLFLTHTKLDGKFTLRLCVGQTNTEARHVENAWKKICEENEKILQARTQD
jgi:aromatic-L-amino-acid decarboxylase